MLTAEIGADELLTLTAEDLGSASRRQENKKIREHAMWECERGQTAVVRCVSFHVHLKRSPLNIFLHRIPRRCAQPVARNLFD